MNSMGVSYERDDGSQGGVVYFIIYNDRMNNYFEANLAFDNVLLI